MQYIVLCLFWNVFIYLVISYLNSRFIFQSSDTYSMLNQFMSNGLLILTLYYIKTKNR